MGCRCAINDMAGWPEEDLQCNVERKQAVATFGQLGAGLGAGCSASRAQCSTAMSVWHVGVANVCMQRVHVACHMSRACCLAFGGQ